MTRNFDHPSGGRPATRDRDRKILRMLADGVRPADIARDLSITRDVVYQVKSRKAAA